MKKILAILLAVAMVMSLAAMAGAEEAVITKVALVTDVGTIDDESFNQACWQGVESWCTANGIEYTYYQPTEDSTDARVLSVAQAINEGANAIVMPGYLFGTTVLTVQDEYPDVYFIAVDVAAGDLTFDYSNYYDPSANVACLTFSEEQAGYLAGWAAVKEGYTKLGFLGGMAVPAVVRYGYGFVQGADAAAAELGLTDVTMNYAYGNQFSGDADITAAMDTWYSAGTEVVFACGGGIYTSAAEAAAKVDGKVIGVDTDQSAIIDGGYGEGMTVTSAMKGLAATVKSVLGDLILNDAWSNYAGQVSTLGLIGEDPEANFVQLPMASTQFAEGFTEDDYSALVAAMFNGEITVSSDIETEPAVTAITVDYQGNIK